MYNRTYPENANFKACAPSTCGVHETEKCWKFELGILNSSVDTTTQKYMEHKGKAEDVPSGYKWAIFSYFILLGYCTK